MREEPDIYADPNKPYKRTIVRTKQNWVFELIRRGETKVLFQYLAFWIVILVLFGILGYFFIRWLWGIFF